MFAELLDTQSLRSYQVQLLHFSPNTFLSTMPIKNHETVFFKKGSTFFFSFPNGAKLETFLVKAHSITQMNGRYYYHFLILSRESGAVDHRKEVRDISFEPILCETLNYSCFGHTVDISARGLKIEIPYQIPAKEAINVTLSKGQHLYKIQAAVAWETEKAGHYFYGLKIS